MKNKKINIKTIFIILLILIIISLIIFNIKNTNIEKQEMVKEQLGESTTSNAYVSMKTHLSEINSLSNSGNGEYVLLGQCLGSSYVDSSTYIDITVDDLSQYSYIGIESYSTVILNTVSTGFYMIPTNVFKNIYNSEEYCLAFESDYDGKIFCYYKDNNTISCKPYKCVTTYYTALCSMKIYGIK